MEELRSLREGGGHIGKERSCQDRNHGQMGRTEPKLLATVKAEGTGGKRKLSWETFLPAPGACLYPPNPDPFFVRGQVEVGGIEALAMCLWLLLVQQESKNPQLADVHYMVSLLFALWPCGNWQFPDRSACALGVARKRKQVNRAVYCQGLPMARPALTRFSSKCAFPRVLYESALVCQKKPIACLPENIDHSCQPPCLHLGPYVPFGCF